MDRATRRALLLALAALAACGGRTDAPFAVELAEPARIGFDGTAERARATALLAVRHWGGSERDLAGYTLHVTGDEAVDCAGTRAVGCTDTSGHIRIAVGLPRYVCIEASSIAHEMGHVALDGDPDHVDPRWSDPAFARAIWHDLAAGLPADSWPCGAALGGYEGGQVPLR